MAAIIRASQVLTVAAASAKFTNEMAVGHKYLLISDTDCWFTVGLTGGSAAVAVANSVYLPAGVYVELKSPVAASGFVHLIRKSDDGKACLVLLEAA